MKKLDELSWTAKIDGVDYGSKIRGGTFDRDSLHDFLGVIYLQIEYSLQKILFGKTDSDLMAEEAEKRYKERGKFPKGVK